MKTNLHIIMIALISTLIFFFPSAVRAQYSDNDILIEKMVQKGLLSPIEAEIIKDQTKEYVAKHMVEGRLMTLPEWVQHIKLKGEFKLRSQYEKGKDNPSGRQRGKIGAKIGLIAKFDHQWEVGVGIATTTEKAGSQTSDPRSTTVDFTDSFDRAGVRLDYAYAENKTAPWFKIIGGKYERGDYLWTPTDLYWDNDLNPTGGSIHIEKNIGSIFKVFANAGAWLIDERESQPTDPAGSYAQPGVNLETDHIDATLTGNYYQFYHMKGRRLDNTACSNSGLTLAADGSCSDNMDFNFREHGASLEVGYRHMINEEFKRIAFFGDYIRNDWAPKHLSKGWAYGGKIGDMNIRERWDWQLGYQFSRLGLDAVPDILPNSDRYYGRTGVKGHKGFMTLGLARNVLFHFEYYYDKRFQYSDDALESPEEPRQLFKADLKFKF